ncbi:MAG: hypothetical protein EXS41_00235 [Opitutaceae bacterium]|nr:hypothetical protein [Opitutaceae bacterium]
MRSPFVFLLAAIGLVLLAHATPLNVIHVWPGYRTAESFDRISEYFSGQENPGRQTILRSQPAARAGYYFLVRLENPGTVVAGAVFDLHVISPASPAPRTFTFKADVPPGSHAFSLGLTGGDWPAMKASAVAWLLTVRASDGTELARQQSFLWSMPDAK